MGPLLALAKRVESVRAELSEAVRDADDGKPGALAMVWALKKDLFALESRLAAAAHGEA